MMTLLKFLLCDDSIQYAQHKRLQRSSDLLAHRDECLNLPHLQQRHRSSIRKSEVNSAGKKAASSRDVAANDVKERVRIRIHHDSCLNGYSLPCSVEIEIRAHGPSEDADQ